MGLLPTQVAYFGNIAKYFIVHIAFNIVLYPHQLAIQQSPPDPNVFRQRIDDFFNEIHNYKEQLQSLINTNFQKLKSVPSDSQTYIG